MRDVVNREPPPGGRGPEGPEVAPAVRLRDLWPPGLGALLPAFFDEPLVVEREATCEACAMCPPDGSEPAPDDARWFHPHVKCCSFHPFTPNYAVGALLADTDPRWEKGRTLVRDRLAERLATSPLGLLPPRPYAMAYEQADAAFGRSRALVCPWYEAQAGSCVLWPYRGAGCATWFCKFVHGGEGLRFWTLLRRYLGHAEMDLAVHAADALGLDAYELLLGAADRRPPRADELDGEPPPREVYDRVWGAWAGREAALCDAAWRVVSELGPRGYERVGGAHQRVLLGHIERTYRAMLDPTIPPRLIRNPGLVVFPAEGDRHRLVAYSNSDPIDVGARLYRMLDRFDGRSTTDEVRKRIQTEDGLRLTDGLLRKLCAFHILIEPASAGQPPTAGSVT